MYIPAWQDLSVQHKGETSYVLVHVASMNEWPYFKLLGYI